jgi:hypothetical protein
VFDSISDNAQRQRLNLAARLGCGIAIGKRAGEGRDLGDPSAIRFSLDFDHQHAYLISRPTYRGDKTTSEMLL